ncbi:hypothetical protein C1I93_05485 [Micromonospora endophytica]|uniref:Uncharacterized protein n=2 Tax=Micromonospora endophytica TaxID=515350 RepID=A0A2W2E3H9_9ACTN|nr:hypothetical protein C1I93_05485 [Micromonospora endophytica]RIW40594.1 hypothetical protein D3H59_28820 [Micromonospora endophytica]BCJ59157.1 hypothetical protein Jiend_25790 [Micromonospora endophytica]
MNEQPLSDVIRAMARADWDGVDAILEEIRRSDQLGNPLIIGGAFALAVNRHFPPNTTPSDVAAWVCATRLRYNDRDTLPALEMEGLIRAALGEPELVDNIPAETALGVEVFILGELLLQTNLSATELDELVADAEELAAEYRPPSSA